MSYDFSKHEAYVVREAAKAERNQIIEEISSRICFDHKANGTCEHGQCWALHDLRAKLQGVELHDE